MLHKSKYHILVGGLEHLDYFSHHIGNVIIPTDFHSIIFQRGRYTTNQCVSGWWFGTFFIFHNIWDNPSHWLIFFRWVETTNQIYVYIYIYTSLMIRPVCLHWQVFSNFVQGWIAQAFSWGGRYLFWCVVSNKPFTNKNTSHWCFQSHSWWHQLLSVAIIWN